MTGLVPTQHGYYRVVSCQNGRASCRTKMVMPRAGPYSLAHLVTYSCGADKPFRSDGRRLRDTAADSGCRSPRPSDNLPNIRLNPMDRLVGSVAESNGYHWVRQD